MKANEKNLQATQTEWMAFIYKTFSNGIRAAKSHTPREWLEKRKLSIEITGACFNSGQIHHRQSQAFKDALEGLGFLEQCEAVVKKEDLIAYKVFGKFSMMFPLRNAKEEIVNFYAITLKSDERAYMNQQPGLYPSYPHEMTKKLYVVNSILEAATLLQARVLDNREAILALHDGKFMPEHGEAILRLKHLQEAVYIDAPLLKAGTEKIGQR